MNVNAHEERGGWGENAPNVALDVYGAVLLLDYSTRAPPLACKTKARARPETPVCQALRI